MAEHTIFSSKKFTSGGGSNTSSEIDLRDDDTLTVNFQGDSNSSDFDVELQANTIYSETLGRFDNQTGKDATANGNNALVLQYDVSGLSKAKLKVTNQAGSDTTMTVKGRSDHV